MKKYNYFKTMFIAFKNAFKDCPFIVICQIITLFLYIPNEILWYTLLEKVTNKSYDFVSGTNESFLPAINYIILLIY